MRLSKTTLLSLITLIIIIGGACSSGKKALEQGNYYDAVITAINRLRRNTDNKKSAETLRNAYPMAVRYYEDRANSAMASNAEFKWREVVQHYNTLQSMYDEIQRSPGALKVIPNPNNYGAKLADARQKAAEESYQAGIMALGVGDRANAKKAYYLFINANEYAPGYKDVAKKIQDALGTATVKVAVEPIPVVAKNYALDAHYFDSKLNEYLLANQTNEFVRYYKLADAKSQGIHPDHIVQLSFEEFTIGQVYVNEKESQMEKDSVVVAYTFTDTKGKVQQKEVDAPKILPVAGGVKVVETSGGNTGTKSTDAGTTPVDSKPVVTTPADPKPADSKPVVTTPVDSKPADSKPVVTTPADPKPADSKPVVTTPVDSKPADSKPVVTNPADSKPADPQPVVTNPVDSKPADPKPADSKPEGAENNSGNNDDKKDDAGKAEEQVAICHQPPGKPSERKTLTVPQSAVKAHLAHGDIMGECKTEKKDDKGKGKDGGGMASLMPINNAYPVMIASTSNDNLWYLLDEVNTMADTTKVFGKVKATVHQYKKTITSRGVLNFRIIDAKARAVISEQRMPSESVWVSEWLTYNGDGRALTSEQEKLARQKELPPPTNQDLFAEFTKPLFDQITNKITEFYKNY
jgi:hypothetical protein